MRTRYDPHAWRDYDLRNLPPVEGPRRILPPPGALFTVDGSGRGFYYLPLPAQRRPSLLTRLFRRLRARVHSLLK